MVSSPRDPKSFLVLDLGQRSPIEISWQLNLKAIQVMSRETLRTPGSFTTRETTSGHSIIRADDPRVECDILLTTLTDCDRLPPPFGIPFQIAKDMTCSLGKRYQQARVRELNVAKWCQYALQTKHPSLSRISIAIPPSTTAVE